MKEIKNQDDLELYSYYIFRDNKLYMVKTMNDVTIGENYCHVFTAPSTPPDVVLSIDKKTNDSLMWFNSHIREVINRKYYTPEGIRNFLLGVGEFKNHWEK
jgi:hypothetical protein